MAQRREQPTADLGAQVALGEEAKRVFEGGYIQPLLERLDAQYREAIICLKPADADKFSAMQERRAMLIDLRSAIIGDMDAGTKALARLQGETTKAGRVA